MKMYDPALMVRVTKLREGLEPQPLAKLMAIAPELKLKASRCRRILTKKVYPGDAVLIYDMECAKEKLLKARS